MVDHNEATFEVHVTGDHDATEVRGGDLRAQRRFVIKPLMYAECPAVVCPPHAKGRGIRRIGRRDKRTLPKPVRSRRLEYALLDRNFFIDLFLNFLWWLDEFLRNSYRRKRVRASNYRDVDSFIAQAEGIVAGRSVQVHAGKGGERGTIG